MTHLLSSLRIHLWILASTRSTYLPSNGVVRLTSILCNFRRWNLPSDGVERATRTLCNFRHCNYNIEFDLVLFVRCGDEHPNRTSTRFEALFFLAVSVSPVFCWSRLSALSRPSCSFQRYRRLKARIGRPRSVCRQADTRPTIIDGHAPPEAGRVERRGYFPAMTD